MRIYHFFSTTKNSHFCPVDFIAGFFPFFSKFYLLKKWPLSKSLSIYCKSISNGMPEKMKAPPYLHISIVGIIRQFNVTCTIDGLFCKNFIQVSIYNYFSCKIQMIRYTEEPFAAMKIN